MTWFMSISDKYYHPLCDGTWRPWIKKEDLRKGIEVEYMAMRSRFKAKKFIIPVLLADVLIHLFSDDVNERNFMVRGWCLFDTYSRQDTTAGYPLGYTTRNGPVPIKMASTLSPYAPTGPAPPTSARNSAYRWTEDQYRWAILALRAITAPAQYHVESNKKNEHAHSKGDALFPSMFLGQDRWSSGGWDKDQYGCMSCDAHTMVFTYIALAEIGRLNRGGLSIGTVTHSKVEPLIRNLERRRYKYEDFWLLISQQQSQRGGCGDSGNAWAMKKLNRLDWENKHTRDAHWNHLKLKVIKKEIASFKNRNIQPAQPAQQDHAGQVAPNGLTLPNATKGTTSARIEIDLSDSDDDIVELWDHQSFRAGSTSTSKKRGYEQVDPEEDRKSKKTKEWTGSSRM